MFFVAVQFVDIIWAILVAIGVERVSYDIEASFFLRTFFDFYPYSHSLLANLIIAFVVYLVVNYYRGKTWGFMAWHCSTFTLVYGYYSPYK